MPSSLCAPVTESCLQCHTSPGCECTKGTRPLQQLSINMLKWELCVVFSREKGKTKTLLDLQRSSLFCTYYNPQAEKYPVPSEKEEEDPRAANRQIKWITVCRAVTINVGLRGLWSCLLHQGNSKDSPKDPVSLTSQQNLKAALKAQHAHKQHSLARPRHFVRFHCCQAGFPNWTFIFPF